MGRPLMRLGVRGSRSGSTPDEVGGQEGVGV